MQNRATTRTSLLLLIGIVAGLVATYLLLWQSDIPLGVEGEWTWNRSALSADAIWLIVVAGCWAGSYVAAVAWLLPRIGRSVRWTAGGLCFLTVGGFIALWAMDSTSQWPVTSANPVGDRADLKRAWTLYYDGTSGYFTKAAGSRQSTSDFLAEYEAEMAKRDYLHIGTHPPGLILLHRGLLSICRSSPGISRAVLSTQSQSVRETLTFLERSTKAKPLAESKRAALWLAVLLTYGTAALTVVPLFLLVRGEFGARVAWMTASFWPLVPALAIFLPKSDALFPFIGMLFLWCWRASLRRRSIPLAVVAGLVMWCGLMLSLALLPIALFAVVLTCWETFGRPGDNPDSQTDLRGSIVMAVVAIATFAMITILFSLLLDANLPAIWRWNFENHARFYEFNERTYGFWLPVNVLELTLAVGWPMALLAGVRIAAIFRRGECRQQLSGSVAAGSIVILMLWLSGKNMGEAGRLWLFLTPWLLWMTAGVWHRFDAESKGLRLWMTVLALQFVTCVLTVMRVTGLMFADM